MEMHVHKVRTHDTGIGREGGYRDDQELVAAGQAQRAELEATLTPEALAALDAAEADLERRLLHGDS